MSGLSDAQWFSAGREQKPTQLEEKTYELYWSQAHTESGDSGEKKEKKNRAFIDVRAATGEVTEEFIGVGEWIKKK